MKCSIVVIVTCLALVALVVDSAAVESELGPSVTPQVKKREADYHDADEDYDDDDDDGDGDTLYDQRQTDGETNIRLNIKNFQIRVPESSLETLKNTGMVTVIRDSILKLFGIPYSGDASNEKEPEPPVGLVQQEISETEEQQQQQQQQQMNSNSMLQVNGNNLPAKFFLEISDFLMNNPDNDAVDDKRVESNHNKTAAQIYETEEIKIERLENVNNVKNETITISKKRRGQGHATEQQQNLTAYELTENKFSNNVTQNHTATEDRFEQTRPIRLDTVVMQVEMDAAAAAAGKPKTLREKVIWRMDDDGEH